MKRSVLIISVLAVGLGVGLLVFKEKKGGGGRVIENYPVGQTIENMNESIRDKHEEEKKKAKAAKITKRLEESK